ncbi:MAG: flagellar motor switch protein FliN [Ilumatobacter sp.]
MTKNAQSVDTSLDSQVDYQSLIDATRELATSMGITSDPERGSPWPIDVGQKSVTSDFHGDVQGRVYLSLADADVQRLLDDPDGATTVVRDLVAAIGISPDSVFTAPFRHSDDLPAAHVVARSDDRIVAFGVTIDLPESDEAVAAAFEPTQLSATGHGVGSTQSMGAPITLLSDVDMHVTVELGRTKLPMRELLSLQPGMVVRLDRQAGAAIDVYVNGRLLARGEVVVLDDQFGLRITEIVSETAGGR